MNLTLRTFFPFLLLFHEFRVHPSQGLGEIAKTIRAKGFLQNSGFKRFQPISGLLPPTCFCSCVLLPVSQLMVGCFWYSADIIFSSPLIVILDKCSSVRLLSCLRVCVHTCASLLCLACFHCSVPSDLCSSFWLAWHCHETKSWSVVIVHMSWLPSLSSKSWRHGEDIFQMFLPGQGCKYTLRRREVFLCFSLEFCFCEPLCAHTHAPTQTHTHSKEVCKLVQMTWEM